MKMPEIPPDFDNILETLQIDHRDSMLDVLRVASPLDSNGKYRHWDILKYLDVPEPFENHGEWWAIIKLARKNIYRHLPIKGINGINFKFSIIDKFLEHLQFIDENASGHFSQDKALMNPQMKNTYLVNSIIEEAITSSQLEGATTTRKVAKEMIIEDRKPRDSSERMILNNYKAIHYVHTLKKEKLSPHLIREIHKIVSDKTLGNNNKSGAYRDENDPIQIVSDNEIVFTPPKYHKIEDCIQELCDFVNNDNYSGFFIHPVIKAIFVHFYFAYIHPFVDGNGRTARALFYWYMLKKGYWLIEFISISRILKKAPAKYGLSFLYTETDDNDLSYFIDYQLSVIERAIKNLYEYIEQKTQEIVDVEKILKKRNLELNLRQISLLQHALKSPGYIYSIHDHKNYHNIAYETARTDLLNLSDDIGLFVKVKEGKSFVFIVPSDLMDRINKL